MPFAYMYVQAWVAALHPGHGKFRASSRGEEKAALWPANHGKTPGLHGEPSTSVAVCRGSNPGDCRFWPLADIS